MKYLRIYGEKKMTEALMKLDLSENSARILMHLRRKKIEGENIWAETIEFKDFIIEAKEKDPFPYDRPFRRKQNPISLALEILKRTVRNGELTDRGWIEEQGIKSRKYKLKKNFDDIITDLEKQKKEAYNNAMSELDLLLKIKDYDILEKALISLGKSRNLGNIKELGNLLGKSIDRDNNKIPKSLISKNLGLANSKNISFDISNNTAKILAYFMMFEKGKSKEIEIKTNLNLPMVSKTIKLLKLRGWIHEEEEIYGRGRPYKIYSLKVRNEEIVAEYRVNLEKTHDEAVKAIKILRDFNRKHLRYKSKPI